MVVTNEIFSDGIEYDEETLRYQKYLGQINAGLAKMADLVVEIVYGIPVVHKGKIPEGVTVQYQDEKKLSEGNE